MTYIVYAICAFKDDIVTGNCIGKAGSSNCLLGHQYCISSKRTFDLKGREVHPQKKYIGKFFSMYRQMDGTAD